MPNSIPDDRIVVQNARRAVAAELRKKKILEQPIAKYDPKTGNGTQRWHESRGRRNQKGTVQ